MILQSISQLCNIKMYASLVVSHRIAVICSHPTNIGVTIKSVIFFILYLLVGTAMILTNQIIGSPLVRTPL